MFQQAGERNEAAASANATARPVINDLNCGYHSRGNLSRESYHEEDEKKLSNPPIHLCTTNI